MKAALAASEGVVDPLEGVTVFVAVAECGSFSAAAEKLGLSKSTISAQVARLERRIGARLLQRSTRSVSLTEAGRAYLCEIDTVLDRVRQAERAAQAETREPRGPLRVSAPAPFVWSHLAPLLPEFMARHPQVTIELHATAEVVDLVAAGFDLAIRLCPTSDPCAIVRQVGVTRIIAVAAPALVEARGVPDRPEDLAGWPALINASYPARERADWHWMRNGELCVVTPLPALIANSVETLHRLALAGCGVALIGEYVVVSDLAAGRLVRLLPDWSLVEVPILAVYPDNRQIATKVRAFVDFVARRLEPASLMAPAPDAEELHEIRDTVVVATGEPRVLN